MHFTYDETLFSDLHKDAYGFRPRGHEFYSASPERAQEIWDSTVRALEAALHARDEQEQASVRAFEARIADAIGLGAADRSTAIRWIVDGLGLPHPADGDHACHLLGLPFGLAGQIDAAVRGRA